MATHHFRSYSLQDTQKEIKKRPSQESDHHSDFAEASLGSSNSTLRDIKRELDFDEFSESELSCEEEIKDEPKEEIGEKIGKETEEKTEEELEEEIDDELEDTDEELEEEIDDELEDTDEELEEEIGEELQEETDDELEEETEEELEETDDEYEEDTDEELQEETDDELEKTEEELEEEIEEEHRTDIEEVEEDIRKETLHEFDCLSDIDEASLSLSDLSLLYIANAIREDIDLNASSLSSPDSTLREIMHEFEEELDYDGASLNLIDLSLLDITKEIEEEIDFEEFIESEFSCEIDLQNDLLKEGGATTALEVNVNSVKRDQARMEEDLETERKEKEALPKTLSLNQEQAQASGRQASIEHMKAARPDGSSGETDREACSRLEEQVKKEKARFLQVNKKLERLTKAPAAIEALMYDKETLSLQNKDITGKLEAMEAKYKDTVSQKDDIIFENQAVIVELRHSVNELTLHRSNSERKKAQIEDALNQQRKDADKLDSLTRENQQVASVNKKLRSELDDAVREIQRAHVADISKQRKLDDLTEENHRLASKSKRVQGELEDALNNISLAREAAMNERQDNSAKLDYVKKENIQVVYENKRLQGELKDAQTEIYVDRQAAMSQQQEHRAKLDNLTSENVRVASENKRLQGELENVKMENIHVASENKRLQGELENVKMENIHVASENKRLQGELENVKMENIHVASENKRLQGELEADIEACSRLEERVKKEKVRFLRVSKKLERLKKAPAAIEALMYDKETLSQQSNDIKGKLEAMEAKCKETVSQKDDIIFKNQAVIVELRHSVDELTAHRSNSRRKKAQIDDSLNHQRKDADKLDNLTLENQQLDSVIKRLQGELEEQAKKEKARFLRAYKKVQRLKRGQADTEELMYDKETRRMESKYITGKLEAMEPKYDLLVQRDRAHSRQNEEVLAQKDGVLLKNHAIKLQYIVDELRTQQSESKTKQAQLEDTLHQEQIQRAVLEERVSNTASTLEKQKKKTVHFAYALKTERATSKRYRFELTEAKINQVKLQERQHLSPSRHNL